MQLSKEDSTVECDVLIVGSGAGGLSAAITAAWSGLKTIVVEKNPTFGGTTAWSGGYLWIPCNPLAKAEGIQDSPEQALTYIRHEAGNFFNEEVANAFVKRGPEMVDFFQNNTTVKFSLNPTFPDYHTDVPGSVHGGRAIWAQPYRGNKLGKDIAKMNRPIREFSFLGMGIAKSDLRHLLSFSKSLTSAIFVIRLMTRLVADYLVYGRPMRLVNGNALAARLGKSAKDLDIPIWLSSPARGLIQEGGAVRGAEVEHEGRRVMVRAKRGVVLACGGFPHDIERRQSIYRHKAGAGQQFPMAPPGNTGDGLRLAESAGGQISSDWSNSAYWLPVSRVTWPDGRQGLFPHSGGVDRTMPGFITVNAKGRRFVNESTNYHDVCLAMIRECEGSEVSAYLVCDHRALRKYGLGVAKPFPVPLSPYLKMGYLTKGSTLQELATQLGIDPAAFSKTVEEFNLHARNGVDPKFDRGVKVYDRYYSDPTHSPNPCLAPLEQPPFYGVKIYIGDAGTVAGIKTDANARVLDARGVPIEGLYASGNDMANVSGGSISGGGMTLGPAMTFGYIAGRHLASL